MFMNSNASPSFNWVNGWLSSPFSFVSPVSSFNPLCLSTSRRVEVSFSTFMPRFFPSIDNVICISQHFKNNKRSIVFLTIFTNGGLFMSSHSQHLRNSFLQTFKTRSPALRERLIKWRKTPVVVRVEKPSNPLRARTLGYKAMRGYVVCRVRVAKGKRRRKRPDLGRKPGKNRKTEPPGLSLQTLAENRAVRRFPNLSLVNSYYVGEDGQYKFFEVMFIDKHFLKKWSTSLTSM